jgi:hypothetical protein
MEWCNEKGATLPPGRRDLPAVSARIGRHTPLTPAMRNPSPETVSAREIPSSWRVVLSRAMVRQPMRGAQP